METPGAPYIKINGDFALNKATGVGYIGLICRNERGGVLTASSKLIYANSPLVAEALGLCNATSLAKSLHLQQVILESDNQVLVEACRGHNHNGEIIGIVKHINETRSTNDTNSVTWIAREGNKAAHEISYLDSKGLLCGNWTTCPPGSLRL